MLKKGGLPVFSRIKVSVLTFFKRLLGIKVLAECGHKTPLRGKILCFIPNFQGGKSKRRTVNLETSPDGTPKLCLHCLGEASIRCAWCGGTILPGDKVTSSPPEKYFTLPSYAVKHPASSNEKPEYIGCTHPDCNGTRWEKCGHLGSDGEIHGKKSRLQRILEGTGFLGKPLTASHL